MTRKKSLFLLAAFMFLSSVAAVCSFIFASARTAMAETSDFVFTTGASIRYGEGNNDTEKLNESGLRFTCNIGENTAAVEKITLTTTDEENYYYAMVILPTDYFGTDKVGGYTREQAAEVINYILDRSDGSTNFLINYFSQSKSEEGKLQGVITKILEHNYTRFFTAIAFYKTSGDNYVCAVSDSRSPAYVASRALQDVTNPHIALTTYTSTATKETDEDGDGYYDITGTPYLTIDDVEYAAPLGVETVHTLPTGTESADQFTLSFDAVNRRIVVQVTGDLISRVKTFESNVDVEMQTIENYGTVIANKGGMVLKGEGTFFFTGNDISDMNVNPAFTSYSDVVICNKIAATGMGFTVFSMQDNTTLTIAEGGKLTDSCDTGIYGRLVDLGANCTVNVEGTLSSVAKSLSSDANDTLIVGASASVTIPTKDNGNQLTFGHIAIQGGKTTVNGSIYVADLIVKAGELNISVDKTFAIRTPSTASESHYYFLGGTTNITQSDTSNKNGSKAIWFTNGAGAFVCSNMASIEFNNFHCAVWYDGGQGSDTLLAYGSYLFSKKGIVVNNCDNGVRGDNYDSDSNNKITDVFWRNLSYIDYWNNAIFLSEPIANASFLTRDDTKEGEALTQAQIESPVNWDALKMNVS